MSPIAIYEDTQEISSIPVSFSISHKNKGSSGIPQPSVHPRRTAFANRVNMNQDATRDKDNTVKGTENKNSTKQSNRRLSAVHFSDETRKKTHVSVPTQIEGIVDSINSMNRLEQGPSAKSLVASVTKNNTRVSDLSFLRRSLRATVKSPNPQLTSKEVLLKEMSPANTVQCFSNDQHNLALTPTSILRGEMDNEADISLLCSPNLLQRSLQESARTDGCNEKYSSGIALNRGCKGGEFFEFRQHTELDKVSNVTPYRQLALHKQVGSSPATVAIVSTTLLTDKGRTKAATFESTQNNASNYSTSKLGEKYMARTICEQRNFEANSDVELINLDLGKQESEATLRQGIHEENCLVEHQHEARCSEVANALSFQLTPEDDLERTSITAEQSDASTTRVSSRWYSAIPSSNLQQNKSKSVTNGTPSRSGFCMDLTDIFVNAANLKHAWVPSTKKNISGQKGFNKSPLPQNKANEGSSNMYAVDVCDDWAQKQCQSLSQWLNYTFEPTEEKEIEQIDATLDRVALRSLVVHRRMERARSEAFAVYKGPEMTRSRKVISAEILKGRIAIRKDRFLHADLSMRDQIMTILFSYTMPWLRLGLETLCGEPIIPANSKSSGNEPNCHSKPNAKLQLGGTKLALKSFLVNRVLSDEKILAKYTRGKCMVPSGPFEKKYNAELNAVVLNRILVLILFLDVAKKANILDKVPNLFVNESDLKSTRDVLLALCRDFLQSEGDFVKHLSRLGIKVHYKQDPIDELKFFVNNLAVDLRDGTRLVKLAELITGITPKSLLTQLRIPVVSRLQKLHNVGLALRQLVQFGVPLSSDLAAHHIVDGHRQMVLKLLWTVVAHCCLNNLIDVEKVEAEIDRISLTSRQQGYMEVNGYYKNGVEKLKEILLRWCQVICSKNGIIVRNLTKDFANGKVVCTLINFYHPTLLRLDEIIDTMNCASFTDLCPDEQEKLLADERSNAMLANKRMSQLGGIPQMIPICDSSSIPEEKSMLFCLTFMCSRLMESSIEIRACYVIQNWFRQQSRRVGLQKKLEAARLIIDSWRTLKPRYYSSRAKKYRVAVLKIEKFITDNVQGLVRLKSHRIQQERQRLFAVKIQKIYRGYTGRVLFAEFLKLSIAAIKLQTAWRSKAARLLHVRKSVEHRAALMIQHIWKRAYMKMQTCNLKAIQIQRIWRGFWSQLNYRINIFDIITVQSCARRKLAKHTRNGRLTAVLVIQKFAKQIFKRTNVQRYESVVRIQCLVRRWQSCKELRYLNLREESTIRIQSQMRAWDAKMKAAKLKIEKLMVNSATMIQSCWRRYYAVTFLRKIKIAKFRFISTVVIQSAWRSFFAKTMLQRLRWRKRRHEAIVIIQCFYRVLVARQIYLRLQKQNARYWAAIAIQCWRRQYLCKVFASRLQRVQGIVSFSFDLAFIQRSAALAIQRSWHRKQAYNLAGNRYNALIKIQSIVRMRIDRLHISILHSSVVTLQSTWRSYSACRSYRFISTEIAHCQNLFRSWKARRDVRKRSNAIQSLQCFFRKCIARSELEVRQHIQQQKRQGAVTIQQYWRRFYSLAIYYSTINRIVLLQSLRRCKQANCVMKRRKISVITIQKVLRVFLACRRVQRVLKAKLEREQRQQLAAIRIQSVYRGSVERTKCCLLDQAATSIQRIFRGFLIKADHQLLILDIIVAQSMVRRWLALRLSRQKKNAILILQTFARQCIACFERNRLESARTIQCVYRGHLARMLATKHFAARQIQKTWRCFYIHIDFMLLCIEVISIQAYARRALCMRSYSRTYKAIVRLQSFSRRALCTMRLTQRHRAATIIQACARMVPSRVSFLIYMSKLKSATLLQSTMRMWKLKSNYLLMKIAAIIIERNARRFLVRLELEVKFCCVTEIQRIWRGYIEYSRYALKILSAIMIQSTFRMSQSIATLNKIRFDLMVDNMRRVRSARLIQVQFKCHLARAKEWDASLVIQRTFRLYLMKIAFSKLRKGIIKLQSAVRGEKVRTRQSSKVRAQVARVRRANMHAKLDPKMQLSCRTKAALEVLRKSRSLSEIMNAICLLEFATRYSENCCKAFAAAGAPDILFPLIRSCNRSLPHIEIVRYVLLTLANVAKYDYLLHSVASAVAAEVFLDLAQMFRDKDAIFPLAASLLHRTVSNSEDAKNQCASRENQKRLKGIVQLVTRKLSIAGHEVSIEHSENRNISNRTRAAHRQRTKTMSKNHESCDAYAGLCSLQHVLRETNDRNHISIEMVFLL